MSMSFGEMVREYFRIVQPAFSENNPRVIDLTSAFLPLLASKAWINRGVEIPATFFVSLIGHPRSGKTGFLRNLTKLLPEGISRIPIGSPEFIVQMIDERRHGIIIYDELSQLAKLVSRYMDTFMPLLNNMYYLSHLDMGRRDNKKSVFIPAEEYFVDVIFSGTQNDWEELVLKAVGGFSRRILRVNVHGRIPLFTEDGLNIETERKRYELMKRIQAILKALSHVNLKIIIRGLGNYASIVETAIQDPEKQSLVEEYSYKYLAGKLLAHLLTVDKSVKPEDIDTNYILRIIEENAKNTSNIDVTIYNPTSTSVDVDIFYQNPEDPSLDSFLPPNFTHIVVKTLIGMVSEELVAPGDVVLKTAQKIKDYVEQTGDYYVTMRRFIREILKLRNAMEYKPLIELLEDGGYIRIFNNPSRNGKLVILNTTANICGNCAFFGSVEHCPKIYGVQDKLLLKRLSNPLAESCTKFILREKYEEALPDE